MGTIVMRYRQEHYYIAIICAMIDESFGNPPDNSESPSQTLSKQLVSTVTELCGQGEWSGDNPYEVTLTDAETGTATLFTIRKGADWITIQEQKSANPRTVQTYLIRATNDVWDYIDPDKIKHGESSIVSLQKVHEKLKKAVEASRPKEIK